MFEAPDAARLPFAAAIMGTDARLYSSVTRSVHSPWLHVGYEAGRGRNKVRQTLFTGEVDALVALQARRGVRIVEVELVLPGYLTGEPRWTMAPLAAVWTAQGPPPETRGRTVYVLEDGRRLAFPPDRPADTLTLTQCRFTLRPP